MSSNICVGNKHLPLAKYGRFMKSLNGAVNLIKTQWQVSNLDRRSDREHSADLYI